LKKEVGEMHPNGDPITATGCPNYEKFEKKSKEVRDNDKRTILFLHTDN
jgi:hypothetical protein